MILFSITPHIAALGDMELTASLAEAKLPVRHIDNFSFV